MSNGNKLEVGIIFTAPKTVHGDLWYIARTSDGSFSDEYATREEAHEWFTAHEDGVRGTYSKPALDKGSKGTCPCCFGTFTITRLGMAKHGHKGERGGNMHGWCDGWSKRPLEQTDEDALVILRIKSENMKIEIAKKEEESGHLPTVSIRKMNSYVDRAEANINRHQKMYGETKDEIITRQAAEIKSLKAQLVALASAL